MGGYLSKSKEIPDSQWKEQNKASNENPMYQFAHLEKGGRLISAYEQDDQQKGREAVIKMAREEIISYLYEDGGGSLVTDVVHRQWLMGCLKKNVSNYLFIPFFITFSRFNCMQQLWDMFPFIEW